MRSKPFSTRSLPQSRSAGFTLIELIVAVAILAILVAVAVPSFRELSLNNRSTSTTNELMADLAMARSEAVKNARRGRVQAKAGGWNNGWTVAVEVGDPAAWELIKDQGPINPAGSPPSNSFALNGFEHAQTGSTGTGVILFGPMGQALSPDTGARFGLCRPDGLAARSRGIRIDISGRAQAVRGLAGLGLSC